MRISHTRKSDTVPPLIGGSDWDDLHEVVDPLKPLSGQYYGALLTPVGAGQHVMAADRVSIVPISVRRTVTIDRLGVGIALGVASATVRLALYDQIDESDALGGWPGNLLNSSSDMAADTIGAYAEFVLSRTLHADRLYWVGIWSNAAIRVRGNASTARYIKSVDAGNATATGMMFRTITYAGGSWPTTWGRTASELVSDLDAASNQNVPIPTWRAA